MTVIKEKYKEIANKKRLERDSKWNLDWLIPESNLPSREIKDVLNFIDSHSFLTPLEIEITNSSAIEIVTNIQKQKWKSLQVTLAFCHRASISHQLCNNLSEIFFDKAIETAKELDDYQLKNNGKTIGPLHGLPVSLKDNFNVKGQATTLGMVNFCFNPEKFEEDSVLVSMLRNLGAILYVKTNVPVAMMLPETKNHIWGVTLNPMNRLLSAGGSSGGEASLIKLKGSPLGIGSDIGGSIRIPSSFQNLYSLKPSFGRFPTFGTRSGLPGLESVNSVNGPIGNNLQDLKFFCESIINSEPWNYDPKIVELPWRNIKLPEKLNLAVLIDDGIIQPTPPIRRGMELVINKLKTAGHDIIEWEPINHYRLSTLITEFFTSDGGKHVLNETLEVNEPLFPYMSNYGNSKDLPVSKLWKLQNERTILIKQVLDNWIQTSKKTKNGKPIDAIIMPVTPFAGNPIDKFYNYVGYTSPFNLCDFSTGTFPVSRVDSNIDKKDLSRNEYYNDTDFNISQDYDPIESHGGGVSLQLICRRFQEEKVLKILEVLEKLIDYKD
ncbi:uncharacterized protein KGF55_002886 [Candida pseudojiufengensis]|uniref:uncharacterized protein n=1 Tax=Candida pseudojiufengensis TaxID=497109 RepID=UPI0022248DCB|nr:uncharacterized protein KGF55_002886 [Candida pseudojiufengensis]KAI5963094.1 hypothetical protein KGF55_002886 [Candida pseudojiufengensis]